MPNLQYSVEKPLNREPDSRELISSFITAPKIGFNRNHGPIPYLDASNHTVTVDGEVQTPLSLNIRSLRDDFEQHEVTCALQCAGNRRETMARVLREVEGISWKDGAVMNCTWRGPLLCKVLERAGISDRQRDDLYAAFASYQVECQDDTWYGGSIPLSTALDPHREVILALEMNGESLPVEHGYPVRVIVPGVAGARSVKWLDRITISKNQSQNFYQRHDYKVLPPSAKDKESAKKYWDKTPPLTEMPINSSIVVPRSGEICIMDTKSRVEVKGYAISQGADGPIVKVEVSADGGNTWVEAEDLKTGGKYCWALWKATIKAEKGRGKTILSRATDAKGNMQTGNPVWNLRGVAYDGYGEAKKLTFV